MRRSTEGSIPTSLRVPAAALGLVALAACAVNPATGTRQLTLMSEGQEIQMGREADPGIVESMGLYPDQELQGYVQEMGEGLAARSERPDLPWTFRVLDDPLVNAFALPGGFIYITRGIMAHLDSEAELAGVLGHEIGHVTARHSVNQISRAQIAQLGLGIGMVLKPELQRFQGLASSSLGLLFLKFGRDDEHQADELGVRYMGRLGYDPAQLSGVMAMLGSISGVEEEGRPPEWLSTHPNPENREEAILEMARQAQVAQDPPLVGREAYLDRLEGLIWGTNPREGFFRGSRFLHPEMAFQLDFPAGWDTRNSKAAVQGVSGEGDLLMVLTLAQGSDPGAGVRTLAAQEGIQPRGTGEGEVNGVPAAWLDFRLVEEGQEALGRALFVQHQGTLLRMVGFGTSRAWEAGRRGVIQALESFRPLTDPEILGVQPARLRIVRVRRATPLSALLEEEGVPERAPEVRRLNRLQGDPRLEAGTLLKVPVGGELPGGV